MKLMHISIVFLLGFGHISTSRADLRVHFIAVGCGDAVFIEKDGEAVALVDAGPPEAGPIVLRYLQSLGFTSLEHLFVTHTHADHVGGIPLILDSLDVGVVHHTGMVDNWEAAQTFAAYLASGQWLVEVTNRGDVPVAEGCLTMEVLSPLREKTDGRSVDPNHDSMVLLITYGSVKILLPADIDADRESWLVEQFGSQLQSEAMKACHHASKQGNSRLFLKTVQPRIVVVSVGPNPWGYPDENTLVRLHQYSPIVLRTDRVGTVILQTDGKTLHVVQPEGIEP